jgi:two-component system, OmpR family, sensor histidine kinase ChvG
MASSRRIQRSLVSRLVLLIIVFIAVPVALYQTFKQAEQDRQTLLVEAVQERGRLVGLGLRPFLQQTSPSPLLTLGDELQRFASPSTSLKVLFRPADQQEANAFFYVASAPPISTDSLTRERDELLRLGVLADVSTTCTGNKTLSNRYRDP